MNRHATITINTAALKHNLSRVQYFAPNRKIMAIIKANAYGHGAVAVAKALTNADAFGVATVGEALELRLSAIENRLVVLEGFLTPQELQEASFHRISLFIHHLFQVDIIEKTKLLAPVDVWIKVDTGMHRLGLLPRELNAAILRLQKIPHIHIMGLATHFAEADNINTPKTRHQLQAFEALCLHLKNAEHSLANSAAILGCPESHASWVRPGIMLYGVSPFETDVTNQSLLEPVMSFETKLIAVKTVQAGESIGYGSTFTCPETMKIGIVAAGYADGYPRQAQNGTPVLISGKTAPLVGRVSMDMIAVNLKNIEEATPGNPVELWGKSLPVQIVAKSAGTISYELLCRMSNAKIVAKYL